MKKFLTLTISILVQGALVFAGSNTAAFLKTGVGARALGMGGAFTAVADDATAAYWNPAGLGKMDRLVVSTMVQQLGAVEYSSLGDVNPDYQYATVLMPLSRVGLKSAGTVGLSMIRNSLDNIPWTTVDGNGQINQDSFNDTETAYFLSYGRPLVDNSLYAGANIKFISQKFSKIKDASATGYGLDVGLLYQVDPRLSLGLMIDSGVSMEWANGHKDNSDLRNKLGVAYKVIHRPNLSLLVSSDLIQARSRSMEGHFGGEFTYKPGIRNEVIDLKELSFRFGVDGLSLENRYNNQGIINENLNWTMGAGFTFSVMKQELGIDYSFGSYRFGAKHRLSFAFFFL